MSELNNSDIVKHVIQTLIDISGRKTTKGQALINMTELLNKLKNKYDFLKHIEIKDTRFLEMDEPVSIMTNLDNLKSNELSKALYDIIKITNKSLGKNAGFFFIKELRKNLGESYTLKVEEMGLDLGLMQLEFEINEISKKL